MSSASKKEQAIFDALEKCSANAKALFYVMRYWADKNRPRSGLVERDGRPISRDALVAMARFVTPGDGPAPFHEPFDELRRAELLAQHGRTLELTKVKALATFRAGRSDSSKRSQSLSKRKGGVLINTFGGVNPRAINTPPPVSLSPTPPIPNPLPQTPTGFEPNAGVRAKAAGGRRGRKSPDAIPGHKAAVDAWMPHWSETHDGGVYPFEDGRDAKAVRVILERFGARTDEGLALSRFAKLRAVYFASPSVGFFAGHPLWKLSENLPEWIEKTARVEAGKEPVKHGTDNGRPAANGRGRPDRPERRELRENLTL